MPPLAVRAAKRAVLAAAELPLTRRPPRRSGPHSSSSSPPRTSARGCAPSWRNDHRRGPAVDAADDQPETGGTYEEERMERDPYEGGRDFGRDLARDLGDEPPSSLRDTPPDILSPIDESSPVSGHVRATTCRRPRPSTHPSTTGRSPATSSAPPSGRSGTQGLAIEAIDRETLCPARRCRAMPSRSLDDGPAGLPVVYTIAGRRLRHRRQRRSPAVVGDRAVELQDAALAQPRGRGRRPRHGPTRSRATGG